MAWSDRQCFGPGQQTLHKTLRTFSGQLFRKQKLFVGTLVTIRTDANDFTTYELTRQSQWEHMCKLCSKFRIYIKNECGKLGSMGFRKRTETLFSPRFLPLPPPETVFGTFLGIKKYIGKIYKHSIRQRYIYIYTSTTNNIYLPSQ